MKNIYNSMDDIVVCKRCKKEITTDMEVEYSRECCEIFCSPDCAIDYYFDYMGSTPLDFDNLPKGYRLK